MLNVGATKDALLAGKCKLAQNMVKTDANDLKALKNEIQAQSGKKIPTAQAEEFIGGITQLIGFLEQLKPTLCAPPPPGC